MATNISISNTNHKSALLTCLDVFNIKYKETKTGISINEPVKNLKDHKITTIDNNSDILLRDMSLMIHCLKKFNEGILYFSLDDIVLINNHYFFINNKKIFNYESYLFKLKYPVEKDKFCPPDISAIQEIPSYISIYSSYYSLACILYYLMKHSYYESLEDLKFIEGLPLFYCMERMLHENPLERKFIYI